MLPSVLRFEGVPRFGPIVEACVEAYTRPGELVLDPFAGSGTTLATARRLGRRALGVEIVPELAAEIRRTLGPDTIVEGDTRRIGELGLPAADLVVTSPPFMTETDHPQNPLDGYRSLDGDYARYLEQLAAIVEELGSVVRPGARLVLDVWNFDFGGLRTMLADDVERRLSGVLPLESVTRITWEPRGPLEDRCLVYRASTGDNDRRE